MKRKNPLSGSASLGRLVVREVRLGDDDAVHDVRGQMVLDGAVDTVVLRVKENAEVERVLIVRRLEVGAGGDAPYGSGGSGFFSSPPPHGASIDQDGTLRTGGWAVIGDSERGLVLRSPEGRFFGFTVDEDGRLVSPGRFLGNAVP